MRIAFARSATRHRVSRADARFVIERASAAYEIEWGDQLAPGTGDRLLFVGDDTNGRPLEVIAVDLGEGQFLVIHAMLLRTKYREFYEEEKWRST